MLVLRCLAFFNHLLFGCTQPTWLDRTHLLYKLHLKARRNSKLKLSRSIAIALSVTFAASNFAFADDWREIYDLGNRKLYLRFPPPKYSDKPIRVWSLISFKTPQQTNGQAWQSWVHLEEFDCQGQNTTSKQVTFYRDAMPIGQPVQEFKENETSAVQPGTGGEVIFDLICKQGSNLQ